MGGLVSAAVSGATEERSELAGAASARGPGIPARSERDQKAWSLSGQHGPVPALHPSSVRSARP
jgi:hypothetical protein